MAAFGDRLRLARDVFAIHYFQPATALWRVFEMEVVLELLRGDEGRGLDLGCGDGTLASIYLRGARKLHWTGLDISPEDVELARSWNLFDELVVASATEIPEPDGSFDRVFSNSALEHMDGLSEVVAQVARVLKPGGRFLFTVPDGAFRGHLLIPRLLRFFGAHRRASRYLERFDQRVAHVNYLSQEEWRELLAAHGLEIRRAVPYLSRRATVAWELLAAITGGVAYLATAGRRSPREVQRGLGIQGRRRPLVGLLAMVASMPWLLPTLVQKNPRHRSNCCYEVVRAS